MSSTPSQQRCGRVHSLQTRCASQLVFVLVLVLLGWGGGTAAAQDGPRFRVETEVVRVPVVVTDKEGHVLMNLPRQAFQILEDGEEREITSFVEQQSDLTLVLLLEYSGLVRYLRGEVLRPAAILVSQILKPKDYAAIVTFDLSPSVLSDFTNQKYKLIEAVDKLASSPTGFSDSNLYDALKFVLEGGTLEEIEYKGLSEVKGRTGVLLIASGRDTFSHINFDEIRRIVANSGVPVYSIGIGELAYLRSEPYLSGFERLDFLQAQSQLETFSEESGGHFYSVRFQGAVDDVLESVAAMLRTQYTLAYRPVPRGEGEEKREIEVLVDGNGDGAPDNELRIQHRQFYYEPDGEGK